MNPSGMRILVFDHIRGEVYATEDTSWRYTQPYPPGSVSRVQWWLKRKLDP